MSPITEESTAQAQAGKSSEAKVEPERDLPDPEVPELAHDETAEAEVLTKTLLLLLLFRLSSSGPFKT